METSPDTDETDSEGLESQNGMPPISGREFEGFAKPFIMKIYDGVEIPASLFHYTSSEGLLGILGSHTLRFSDALFLNDGSESTYGVRLFGHVLDKFMNEKPYAEKEAAERLKENVESAMNFFQPIIFCMSARDNLLNQWRDYGKDVVPYCIEFDTAGLENWQERNFPIFVSKIVYDPLFQSELLSGLVEALYNKTKELQGDGLFEEASFQRLSTSASIEIVSLISRFKNPAFEAEEEWRAICYRPDLDGRAQRKFRTSSLGIVPYYEWMNRSEPRHLPVRGVTVGPSPYAQVSDLALKQFLSDNGYNVRTNFSLIPIRR